MDMAITVGGKKYSSPSAYTRERLGGVNKPSSQTKPSSGGTTSRVIYEPITTPQGGTIGEQAVTKVTTDEKTITVTDLKTGQTSSYKSDEPINAGEVSIPEKNIKSYQEQKYEQIKSSAKDSRVIYEEGKYGDTAKTRITTSGKDILVEDLKTGKSEIYTSPKKINSSEVEIKEKGIKAYPEKEPYDYIGKSGLVNKTSIKPGEERDEGGYRISTGYAQTETKPIEKFNPKGTYKVEVNESGKVRGDDVLVNDNNTDNKKESNIKKFTSGLLKVPKEAGKDILDSIKITAENRYNKNQKLNAYDLGRIASGDKTLKPKLQYTQSLYERSKKPVKTISTIAVIGALPSSVQLLLSGVFTLKSGIELKKSPSYEKAGETLFYATPLAIKSIGISKDIYVRAGSKKIPVEQVTTKGVIEGTETLPLAKNYANLLSEFRNTNIVTTASPGKLKGTVSTLGERYPTEAPGISVTPKGKTSLYFTRVKPEGLEYKYTFNPFKDTLNVPTVTEFSGVKGVKQVPSKYVNVPGFKAEGEFLISQGAKQTAQVYVTKRQMIGQGVLKPKQYQTITDGITKKLREKGSSELETKIAPGQEFYYLPQKGISKIKGFESYTTFGGKAIAIRQVKLISKGEQLPKDAVIVSSKKIIKGQESVSSITSNVRYKTPYSGIKIISSGTNMNEPISSITYNNIKTDLTGSVLSSSQTKVSSSLSKLSSSSISKISSSSSSVSSKVSSISSSVSSGSSSVSSAISSAVSSASSSSSSISSSSSSSVSSSRSSKSGSSSTVSSITDSRIRNPPIPSYLKRKPGIKSTKGYNVLLKRYGKFVKVGTRLPINLALSRGTQQAKKTLGATFKLEFAGTTTQKDIFSKPNLNQFREFKIKKGKKIKTPLTFIQERKYRLGTIGEKQEIRKARSVIL